MQSISCQYILTVFPHPKKDILLRLTWSDTFRSVLVYGKEQESREKKLHNRAKSHLSERFDPRNTFFRCREI